MAIDIGQWWYEIGGVKHGPCSADSLRELIAGGQIDPSNLLWRKGLDAWIQAGSTAEFADAFAPEEPPPLPEKRPPTTPSVAGHAGSVSLWARFWARVLDGLFFGVVVGIPAGALLGYAFPSFWIRLFREAQGGASLILTVMITPVWLIAEAFVLARWGTTPGKWLAGIIVRDHEGNLPSLKASFSRSFHIWWRALGLALPLVNLAALAIAYGQSKRAGGVAPWDKTLDLEVRAAIPRVRTVTAGVTAIIATTLVMLVGVATQQITQRMVNAAIPTSSGAFDDFLKRQQPGNIFDQFDRTDASAQGRNYSAAEAQVGKAHPGWEDTVKTPEFAAWKTAQSPEIQALGASEYAVDAIKMLDLFKRDQRRLSQSPEKPVDWSQFEPIKPGPAANSGTQRR